MLRQLTLILLVGINDYKNQYYDDIIQQAADTTQHTAAGAGLGRGTGAATAIATDVATKKESLDTTAANQYTNAYNQALSEWSNELDAANARNTALNNAETTKLNNLGTLSNAYTTNTDENYANLMNLLMASASDTNAAKANAASVGSNDAGLFGFLS